MFAFSLDFLTLRSFFKKFGDPFFNTDFFSFYPGTRKPEVGFVWASSLDVFSLLFALYLSKSFFPLPFGAKTVLSQVAFLFGSGNSKVSRAFPPEARGNVPAPRPGRAGAEPTEFFFLSNFYFLSFFSLFKSFISFAQTGGAQPPPVNFYLEKNHPYGRWSLCLWCKDRPSTASLIDNKNMEHTILLSVLRHISFYSITLILCSKQ